MEALLLLIALTAIIGVLLAPAIRRRRAAGEVMRNLSLGSSAYGLVPPERLDVRLPGPDPQLVTALEEAQRDQDWQPVARLLALTDGTELRWQRVQSLAGAAARELADARQLGMAGPDGGEQGAGPNISFAKKAGAPATDGRWLRAWRTERPGDAGGAEVYAQFLVWQAMAAQGSPEHRIILEEARAVCHEAARLTTKDDPVPAITEVFIGRELGYGRAEFTSLWSSVLARDPHHMGAHLAALPYWSEREHGSREDAYGFAESAAGVAPPGSLLPALPLFAVYAHLPDANLVRGLYQSAVIERAIEGARYAIQQAPADHPMVPHVRHLLLWFLVRAERYPEAMDEVHAVDGYVGAVPWVDGPDARAEYAAYRAVALAGQEGHGGDPTRLSPPPSSS